MENRMQVTVITPTVSQLTFDETDKQADRRRVASLLSYTDPNAAYMTQKHARDWQYKNRDPRAWQKYLDELKEKETKKMYKEDGPTWRFRTGALHLLLAEKLIKEEDINDTENNNTIIRAEPKNVERDLYRPLPYTLYPYQEAAIAALLGKTHAHIEICTGSGKATIALLLAHRLDLRTVVIVPFKENARALFALFEYHLGEDRVGLYGDGKKTVGRQVTICIGKSLANLGPDADHRKWFRHAKVMIVDESHTWAAETMDDLCHGLFAHVPFRYFMSGTQEKSTQQKNLLASIIGPRVYSLSTADAMKDGFICPHEFVIFTNVPVNQQPQQAGGGGGGNVLALRRKHLLMNPNILAFVAKECASDLQERRCSLVLVEEVGQVDVLCSHLSTLGLALSKDYSLATGKGKAGSVAQAVAAFNAGDVGILIGTSCIATGVNLYPQHKTYNLCGGGAINSVRTCQGAVGRSVRFAASNPALKAGTYNLERFDVKTKTVIIDFDLDHAQTQLHRHLKKRVAYYSLSGSTITYLDFPSTVAVAAAKAAKAANDDDDDDAHPSSVERSP